MAYADLDASPTKAWMIENRAAEEVRDIYALGFGKRPAEELYDVRNDPHHMNNLAGDPAFAARKRALAERLRAVLQGAGRPAHGRGAVPVRGRAVHRLAVPGRHRGAARGAGAGRAP